MDEERSSVNISDFADFIKDLPEAEQPFEGLKAWLLQGEKMQTLFLEAVKEVRLPNHSHGDQWGIVVAGKLDLTVGRQSRTCGPGESYFIPAGAEHYGTLHPGCRAIDCFADRDRYQPR